MLTGQVEFWLEGNRFIRGPGEDWSRHLVTTTPGGIEAFFEEMSRLGLTIPTDMERVVEIARRHALESPARRLHRHKHRDSCHNPLRTGPSGKVREREKHYAHTAKALFQNCHRLPCHWDWARHSHVDLGRPQSLGAHAHINLLGWVTMALFGTYYAFEPDKARTRLAQIQYGVYTIGVVVMMPSLYFMLQGNRALEPLVAVGSLVVFASVLLFAFILFSGSSTGKSGA